jgi:NO-binding membrane sensor protein with MHYT domain
MVDELRPFATKVVRVAPSIMARSGGTSGMHFAAMEEPAAQMLPGPMVHAEIAEALEPEVRGLL